ncbi:MAG TPA: DUF1028 domain-containing protein [Stellaceae bacterium]|nr:DUF1028 domain-containing protein [Stellaceae bacterium]
MTWSIVARDGESGAFGVAVASKFFAVGALCPWARSGVGAVATQSLVNPMFGPKGLALLAEGKPAQAVLETLLAADAGRATRQLHLRDATGAAAAHTGADCIPWCGHVIEDGFSVAGNMLTGPEVIADTAAAYRAAAGRPFAERLIAAMAAGEAAGGDKRGKQAAALLIFTTEDYPFLSLRVDDHAEPLIELRRLYDESRRLYQPFLTFLPRRDNPAGVFDRAEIEAALPRILETRTR